MCGFNSRWALPKYEVRRVKWENSDFTLHYSNFSLLIAVGPVLVREDDC